MTLKDLKDLEMVMYQQWRHAKGYINKQSMEITLAGFKGNCHQCKQQVNKADACPNWKPSNDGRRTVNSGGTGGPEG